MREIKFRGKSVGKEEWWDGSLINLENGKCYITQGLSTPEERNEKIGYCLSHFTDVIPETVGQFVGETDSNEREIYEGDIIEFFTTRRNYEDDNKLYPNHAIVSYSSEEMKFYLEESGTGECWVKGYVHDGNYECLEECKVIGNIHDNPELSK